MKIVQLDFFNRAHKRDFLDLPFHIYRSNPYWVPPLEMEMANVLNPTRHPFYRHSEAAFFLAYTDDGRPAGRIAVINNRRYNEL